MAATEQKQGFAILNPYGQPWSPKLFDTKDEAIAYVANYWGADNPTRHEFKVVHAVLELRVL